MPGGERDPVPTVRRRCRTAEKGAAGTDGGLRPLVLTEADFAVVRQALADKTAAQVTQVAADECD